MIGRVSEYNHLNSLYKSSVFEYLVMYGRRRVGKTTLLQKFAHENNAIYYPAQEKNDALNLREFSRIVQLHFENRFIAAFESWNDALEYIGDKTTKRTALIIDEFPFIADENPTIKSIFQHIIDHKWKKNQNIFLILCGSSVSFMESEVMGSKSPLHDRQTSSLEIKPFDYLESGLFFPEYGVEDKLLAYGILGGIPRYLEGFDASKSIEHNIAEKILKNGAYLHDEPSNLLKAELRETNVYNSILTAIANGRNRVSEIGDYIHEDVSKVSKYMITLQTMRLVKKKVPCGDSSDSRKGIYVLTDNFFKFWFRYEFTNNAYYEMLGYDAAATEIMADISNHMGDIFEGICEEYFIRKAKKKELPFIPYRMGKWWGNNPVIKAQDDVDILMLDKTGKKGIFVECKFTSAPMPYDEYEDLKTAMSAFYQVEEKYMYFISKSGFTESVIRAAKEDGAVLLTLDDLMNV
ncbi:MAG: ATP-binding protein [Erysipelotrichaceae bacterium]|nr:ATP-binding protein [Erysipelotrichaceae bacterium]